MATITPTITTGTPPLQVDTGPGGVSYTTLLNMLGSWTFIVDQIYYRPRNFNQYANPLAYSNFEINSNFEAGMVTTFTDPMQFLPVMFVDTKGRKLVFDGTGCLFFTLLPAEEVQLFFIGKEKYMTSLLRSVHPSNFEDLESKIGKPDFFKDYQDQI